jgi:hypothetical protein
MNDTARTVGGIVGAIIGAGAAFARWLPANVQTAALVMAGFTLLDFSTALWGAALLGQLSSTVMRKKFSAKALQYAAILGISAGVGAMAQQWAFIYAGLFFICGTEAMSVIENALLLESVGISMGPFKPLLDRIRGFFAITNVLLSQPTTTTTTTTTTTGHSNTTTGTTTQQTGEHADV